MLTWTVTSTGRFLRNTLRWYRSNHRLKPLGSGFQPPASVACRRKLDSNAPNNASASSTASFSTSSRGSSGGAPAPELLGSLSTCQNTHIFKVLGKEDGRKGVHIESVCFAVLYKRRRFRKTQEEGLGMVRGTQTEGATSLSTFLAAGDRSRKHTVLIPGALLGNMSKCMS